ncbi:putative photosynthetic complex assembly protein [Palleronia aestuarii]|uniref:Putative photosynthetic complex assembly protein n=1 Tax=Palleronia aestuarii TaxID=568105 RepID=A0A2W7NEJ4_9RHOB|nr:photosynthetic complex assembly protein PuhC [Palleronia aestuarii]PZX16547.1 putative photosynthetic complex assembly protein [Palleronia aestuarii]
MGTRIEGGLYFDAERREMQARDREMIPKGALLGMLALALGSLGLATYASVTDRPTVGQPVAAEVLETRTVTLEGDGVAVSAIEPDGTVLLDTDNGAFIAVVTDALNRVRIVHDIKGNPPVTVARLANGRLVLSDPATGWSTELTSFGAGNTRYWDVLFEQ